MLYILENVNKILASKCSDNYSEPSVLWRCHPRLAYNCTSLHLILTTLPSLCPTTQPSQLSKVRHDLFIFDVVCLCRPLEEFSCQVWTEQWFKTWNFAYPHRNRQYLLKIFEIIMVNKLKCLLSFLYLYIFLAIFGPVV